MNESQTSIGFVYR